MQSIKRDYERAVASCYSTWGTMYHDEYYGKEASFPPIHRDILLRLLAEHGGQKVLDAGCGSAAFARYLVGKVSDIFGFDLTPEMLAEARQVMGALGVPPTHFWQGSVVDRASFVMPGCASEKYDAIVCSGVFPHIPPEEESNILSHIAFHLKRGGLALIEARNELFALFTQNRYTSDFIRKKLVQEDTLLVCAADKANDLRNALDSFSNLMRMDLPPRRPPKENEPSYDDVLSHMHNPFELKKIMEDAGFADVKTHFYHYHCLPPMLQGVAPDFFKEQNLAMEKTDDWRGHFMASAFILSGVKM